MLPLFIASGANAAARFDGTNDYLSRGADLTGVTNTQTGTLSLWFNLQGGDSTTMDILTNSGNFIRLFRRSDNRLQFDVNKVAPDAIRWRFISTPTFTTAVNSGWNHLLLSWRLNVTPVAHAYLNDAAMALDSETGPTEATAGIGYNQGDWFLGSGPAGANKAQVDLFDVWFDEDTYYDLTTASNRRKFITAAGGHEDLGIDGEVPTGSSPPVFFGDADINTWHTNKGAGGGFTENGALTEAPDIPT